MPRFVTGGGMSAAMGAKNAQRGAPHKKISGNRDHMFMKYRDNDRDDEEDNAVEASPTQRFLNLPGARSEHQTAPHTITIQRSASAHFMHLTDLQQDFFSLVRAGVVARVENFLRLNPGIQINCENRHGHTALILAVMAQNARMITYLLQLDDIKLGDCLLHAVQKGDVNIVKIILDKKRHYDVYALEEGSACSPKHNSADFTPDMTPLILAAHNNHYEIIRLLLSRGHVIHKLHPPECFCEAQCKNRLQGESLSDSVSRYNMYKALASPSYICQSSADPIRTSFLLSDELRGCAGVEREFKSQYLSLAETVSQYAVELLAQCCTTEEVMLILNNTQGGPDSQKPRPYERLSLAIQLEQKAFVAHHNCQQVLRCAWLEGWHDWRSLSIASKVARLLPRMFFLPIMAAVYWVAPQSRLVSKYRAPMNKFFTYAASYALFLVIVLLQIALDHDNPYKAPPVTGLEPLIILYVTGLLWRLLKIICLQGSKQFFKQYWNIYVLFMCLLFYSTFVCWFVSLAQGALYGQMKLPRYKWDKWDPVLVGEVFYAYALVFAFGKLFFFFQIGQGLGPLQVSMGYMLRDVMKFAVVFSVIILSFGVAMHMLYHHYDGEKRTIGDSTIAQEPAFTTYKMAFRSLYWAVYGYTPPNYADIIVRDYRENVDGQFAHIYNYHSVTQVMGMMLYAVYSITGLLVLVNMLIAMMSTSFSNVQPERTSDNVPSPSKLTVDADMEWKFARTRVWLVFFEEGQTMPPPFNLIPTPKSLAKLAIWIAGAMTCNSRVKCSIRNCCYIEKEIDDKVKEQEDYEALMGQLVQRYMNNRGRSWIGSNKVEDESTNVKNQVGRLQGLVQNLIIHSSNMDTSTK